MEKNSKFGSDIVTRDNMSHPVAQLIWGMKNSLTDQIKISVY